MALYQEYLKLPQWSNYIYHRDGPFGYDAAWAIGLMLDKAAIILHDTGRRMDEFSYDDDEMGKLFFTLLNETRFIGVSVSIKGYTLWRNLSNSNNHFRITSHPIPKYFSLYAKSKLVCEDKQ